MPLQSPYDPTAERVWPALPNPIRKQKGLVLACPADFLLLPLLLG